ncbi:hypothetical protein D4Q52_08915 [Rhodopseudomonas palustris]|uniref:Uncharacterized protein n=1 Tax=Rhodopseudomonas palustris TaxID=1076 RepID=A0A418VIJ7_RHOPL|nr:hypothetical protein D4Q52_08915 [Rhodopseudomonas palustris]
MTMRPYLRSARWRCSPPPCGEGACPGLDPGSGVGVRESGARGLPPTPTLPRKGGGSELLR